MLKHHVRWGVRGMLTARSLKIALFIVPLVVGYLWNGQRPVAVNAARPSGLQAVLVSGAASGNTSGTAVLQPVEVKAPADAVNTAKTDSTPLVGYADPAAVYCGGLGYKYKVEHGSNGDVGVCEFPDKTSCEAWDFLSGKCAPQYSVCAKQGLDIEARTGGNSDYSSDYAVCKDKATGKEMGTVAKLMNLEEKATKTACIKKPRVTIEQGDALPEVNAAELPSSFDWRSRPKGSYLTNVRDQGQCGSCWAFAAVGVTEAALNISHDTTGNNYDLAEQYLVSGCSGAGNCCGGSPAAALSYIQNTGIPDEGCLAYVDGDYDGGTAGCQCSNGTCSASCANRTNGQCSDKSCANRCSNYATRLVKLSSVTSTSAASRDSIKNLLITKGPLSVTLSMNGSFDPVTHVYHCAAGAPVNHAVVLVAYDDAGGYWVARNSWGSTWNGDGYFKVGYGQCSIENDVYYVGISTSTPMTQLPLGTISTQTPTYTWTTQAGASAYQYVVLQDGAQVYSHTVDASACSTTSCADTPAQSLDRGSYSWHVRAYVNGAWTANSGDAAFTVAPASVPTTVSPTGGTIDRLPAFTWSKVAFATLYQYQLVHATRTVFAKTLDVSLCGDSQCSAPSAKPLAIGSYKWRVRAQINGVWQPFSSFQGFAVRQGFNSQFDGSATGWLQRPGATWDVGDATYFTLGSPVVSSVSRGRSYRDFTYQARVRRISNDTQYGGQAGLIVRGKPRFDELNDWTTGYEFVYSSYYGQFVIWRSVKGYWTTLQDWTYSPAIAQNDWNTLAVSAQGKSLRFYINGTLVWSGTDGAIASGQVGLWSWDGGSPDEQYDVDWATLTNGTVTSLTLQGIEAGQDLHPAATPLSPPNKDGATAALP